jgi:hypothetical protein
MLVLVALLIREQLGQYYAAWLKATGVPVLPTLPAKQVQQIVQM